MGGAVSCGFHSVPDQCADISLRLVGTKANPIPYPGYPTTGVFKRQAPLWPLTA